MKLRLVIDFEGEDEIDIDPDLIVSFGSLIKSHGQEGTIVVVAPNGEKATFNPPETH